MLFCWFLICKYSCYDWVVKQTQLQKRLGLTFMIIFTFLLLVFLLRGVVRTVLIPLSVTSRYQDSLQISFNQANKELDYPVNTLAPNSLQYGSAECGLNTAYHFYAEVGCFVGLKGKSPNVDKQYIESRTKTMESLQRIFEHNHWQESHSEDTTNLLGKLLAPSGNQPNMSGYYGYIRFDKKLNGNTCWFSVSRFDYLFVDLSCNRTSHIGLRL